MKSLLLLLTIPVFAQAPQLRDVAGHDLRLVPAGQFIMGYNRYRADFAETFRKD
ncbi:MAG: hypothetical protein ACI8W8_002103, partial [Rhodothermales bacterium]